MKRLHYLLQSTTDDREIYRVTPRQAIRFIENRAIADYVKNLSLALRALRSMTERKTHNDRTK